LYQQIAVVHDQKNGGVLTQFMQRGPFQWLIGEEFAQRFQQYTAKYVVSDLLVIVLYEQRNDLLTGDMLKYLHSLECENKTFYKLKSPSISTSTVSLTNLLKKEGHDKKKMHDLIGLIANFIIKKRRESDKKQRKNWDSNDMAAYAVELICDQIAYLRIEEKKEEVRKLNVSEILLCIKYMNVYFREVLQYGANFTVKQMMERKKNKEETIKMNPNLSATCA